MQKGIFRNPYSWVMRKRETHVERNSKIPILMGDATALTEIAVSVQFYWLTSWRRPSGVRVMKTLRS